MALIRGRHGLGGNETSWLSLAAAGLLAGAAGVAAMTVTEKLEQALTSRPNSYVPAHTLGRLLRLPQPDADRLGRNWAMHWGQGIVLGPVRALMARRGVGGPFGTFMFTALRLLNDQTLENATGAGAPPWTWPADEQVIDVFHKAIYALVTGIVADRLAGRSSKEQDRAGTPRWSRAGRIARDRRAALSS